MSEKQEKQITKEDAALILDVFHDRLVTCIMGRFRKGISFKIRGGAIEERVMPLVMETLIAAVMTGTNDLRDALQGEYDAAVQKEQEAARKRIEADAAALKASHDGAALAALREAAESEKARLEHAALEREQNEAWVQPKSESAITACCRAAGEDVQQATVEHPALVLVDRAELPASTDSAEIAQPADAAKQDGQGDVTGGDKGVPPTDG